jgi:hypothetical protein
MCANCMSSVDVYAASAGFLLYALHTPTRDALVTMGAIAEPDPLARDVNTVAFLRRLDLDPVEILGAGTVEAVDAWTPAPKVYRDTALRRFIDRVSERRVLAPAYARA